MIFQHSEEVIRLIEKKKRNGIELESFKKFMHSIGDPQLKLRCIHIGGTNGKGSTTNALRSVLQLAGYRVGTFTSPYLETHHDRIRVNDIFIKDKDIVGMANQYYDQWVKYDLSMFEIDMFLAVQYFIRQEVELCIFEVGLGGEQDATNIVNPLVSVITNIGLDHMDFLGEGYENIAKKKAGIIKQGRALITNEKKEACLTIFQKVCLKKQAPLILCAEVKNIEVGKYLHFDYKDYHVKQETLAKYQTANSAQAIEVIDYLNMLGEVRVDRETLLNGILHAHWKGRFEVIQKHPMVIIDGAHNEEGIEALVDSCRHFKHVKVLFSALQDKPYGHMLELLLTLTSEVYVCEFEFERAQSADIIAKGHNVYVVHDYVEAIEKLEDSNSVLLICGSLYFISKVRKYYQEKGVSTR